MQRLCTICVRSGSKGVKNKNVRPILGKPLLAYSVEQAVSSGMFAAVAVSSDSKELLEIAKAAGATVLVERPIELADDRAPKIPAIRHCVKTVETMLDRRFDTVVDLDATSPLRDVSDIIACIRLLEADARTSNVLTAMPSRRSPYFNMLELNPDGGVTVCKPLGASVVRRQDAPKSYDMNASIYAWRRDELFSKDSLFLPTSKLHVMPEERSWDIDSETDFEIVEMLMKKAKEAGSTLES